MRAEGVKVLHQGQGGETHTERAEGDQNISRREGQISKGGAVQSCEPKKKVRESGSRGFSAETDTHPFQDRDA